MVSFIYQMEVLNSMLTIVFQYLLHHRPDDTIFNVSSFTASRQLPCITGQQLGYFKPKCASHQLFLIPHHHQQSSILLKMSRPHRLFTESTLQPKEISHMIVPTSLLVIVTSYFPTPCENSNTITFFHTSMFSFKFEVSKPKLQI